MQELKKKMVEELKNHGINSKQVSIKSSRCTYSHAYDVTVRDLSIPVKYIEDLLSKFESIRYDEYTGEILSGGNAYVDFKRDYTGFPQAPEDWVEVFEKVKGMEKNTGLFHKGHFVMKQDDFSLWLSNEEGVERHRVYGETPRDMADTAYRYIYEKIIEKRWNIA